MKSIASKLNIQHSRGNGFTLVELMIVIAIIGILGAVGLAIYKPFVEKSKCANVPIAVQDTMTALTSAKSELGAWTSTQVDYTDSPQIGGQTLSFAENVEVAYDGGGTDADPFVVSGKRTDFVCPDGDGEFTLQSPAGATPADGEW